jgi:hypothetical protein
MQTDCATKCANRHDASKATNHAHEPSERADIRQSPEQRLFINVLTLCSLREIPSMVLHFASPWQLTFDFQLERQTKKRTD